MSLITYDFTVPKKTWRGTPVHVEIPINQQTVDYVRILFQDGPLGAMGICLKDRDAQFAPGPPTYGWIVDNDHIVEWDEEKMLDGPPYKIKIFGFNEASDHAHTAQIRLTITDKTLRQLLKELKGSIEELSNAMISKRTKK